MEVEGEVALWAAQRCQDPLELAEIFDSCGGSVGNPPKIANVI